MSGIYGQQPQQQWQGSATDGPQTKMGGGQVSPMQSAFASNPLNAGAQSAGGYGGASGYTDYMNRRNSWIDELKGNVAQPQAIYGSGASWDGSKPPMRPGGEPMPNPGPVPPGGLPTSAPPGGPYPGASNNKMDAQNLGGGQPDFMSQFGSLLGEDPRLAYGMTYGSQQQPWYQQNQLGIRDRFFGGDQDRMNQVMNQAAYANPLTPEERRRLGI